MRLNIEKCENGFVLSYWDMGDDLEDIQKTFVFENRDTYGAEEMVNGYITVGELLAFRSMVWNMMDIFGLTFQKHNNYNLSLELLNKEGGKVEV